MNTRPVDEEDSLCLKNQLDQIESELKQLQEILGFWKKLNSLFMEIEKSLPKEARCQKVQFLIKLVNKSYFRVLLLGKLEQRTQPYERAKISFDRT